jgi:hypothetical protein
LEQAFDLGPMAFTFGLPDIGPPDRATAKVSSLFTTPDEGTAEGVLSSVVAQAPALDPFGRRLAKGGARVAARGLESRGGTTAKEPPVQARPVARCPGGASRHAGAVQLGSSAFTAGEASGTPMVLVKRIGGSRGAASAVVTTSGGSARSGSGFRPTRTLVRVEDGGASSRLVEIPMREDRAVESPEEFTVSLGDVRCAKRGTRRRAAVTILDDDAPPPAPAPEFTIGGTVDGLQGSGLVLSDLGTEVPVSANGGFTFPGTASGGQPYEVNVKTQPHGPEQVCSVEHGAGASAART